jgi:hypothetical protein
MFFRTEKRKSSGTVRDTMAGIPGKGGVCPRDVRQAIKEEKPVQLQKLQK